MALLWGHKWSKTSILIHSDNLAIVDIIIRAGTSASIFSQSFPRSYYKQSCPSTDHLLDCLECISSTSDFSSHPSTSLPCLALYYLHIDSWLSKAPQLRLIWAACSTSTLSQLVLLIKGLQCWVPPWPHAMCNNVNYCLQDELCSTVGCVTTRTF